jgi:uncharacterized protein
MHSCVEVVPDKLIVDPLHGDIHLTRREWQILDTMPFQRLRRIKQLQMGHVTYPNATHTRFCHSLGTLAIMDRILQVLPDGDERFKKEHRENLRMAALLHDVGHYPYSHLMEGIDEVCLTEELVNAGSSKSMDFQRRSYPGHEEVGLEIVTKQSELVEAIGTPERARKVADLFTRNTAADPQLSKLLHSSFDMDRVDYLRRDAHAAGVPYGDIDINYLLNSLRVSHSGMLGVRAKALHAAEQFLLARFFMHKTVYLHKTTCGIEEACRQLLRRIRDQGGSVLPEDGNAVMDLVSSPRLAEFTDDYVDRLVHKAAQDNNNVIRSLATCIEKRRPPVLLKEVQVLEDLDHAQNNAGSMFRLRVMQSLRDLAERHEIPLELFLFCETKQVKLEKRAGRITAKEAREGPSEQEDELIKVFQDEKPTAEPQSLVEIPHSLISACSNHFWQAFRLYVVYDEKDRQEKLKQLKDEVSGWAE